jgi:transposase
VRVPSPIAWHHLYAGIGGNSAGAGTRGRRRASTKPLGEPENLPAKDQHRFDELRRADLKTGRAWSIKESLRRLWTHPDREEGASHWKRWYFWATHSRLAPVIVAARTVHRHIANVITSTNTASPTR